jgi:hypothetical protein
VLSGGLATGVLASGLLGACHFNRRDLMYYCWKLKSGAI